jgi:hypothetical protein
LVSELAIPAAKRRNNFRNSIRNSNLHEIGHN